MPQGQKIIGHLPFQSMPHAGGLKKVHTSASKVHKEEKSALILTLASAFEIWYTFRQKGQNPCQGALLAVCCLGLCC